MTQFARVFAAVLIFSAMSINTQAQDFEPTGFKSNIELQLTRIKAEALVSVIYELKQQLKESKPFYMGLSAESEAATKTLTQRNTLNNLEDLAD